MTAQVYLLDKICCVICLPGLKDAEAVQKSFLEEIQLGERRPAQGDHEKGADHLTKAAAECGQPPQSLQGCSQCRQCS